MSALGASDSAARAEALTGCGDFEKNAMGCCTFLPGREGLLDG
jgi:hypothetical protein